MAQHIPLGPNERSIEIPLGPVTLRGNLTYPPDAQGIVLFAHGSGSSRFSPRNRYVAGVLQQAGLATLLFDLLTEEEEDIDIHTRHYRFDIELLADRLAGTTYWVRKNPETKDLRIGYFGASTGAAAALVAAARHPELVDAVVSRGGRPDLAGESLGRVKVPTLLLVGGNDQLVIELNQQAISRMSAKADLMIVPGASHLFEEPGTLEKAAHLSQDWFTLHLVTSPILR